MGTAALRDPAFAERLIARFGAERIAIALDVRDGLAVGQGWLPGASGVVVEEALTELSDRGARTFIVTAIERDGLLAGPNLELLGRMVALDRGAIVASAGVSSLVDLTAVRRIGCVGAGIGMRVGLVYMALPTLTGAFFGQPVMVFPIPRWPVGCVPFTNVLVLMVVFSLLSTAVHLVDTES